MPPSVGDVLGFPGEPLDSSLRLAMEPRFGHDFGRVRIHTDERAAQSASDVNALAYTVGRHIVFGTGQYDVHSERGRRLIAHELAHVVQQEGKDFVPLRVSSSSDQAEREANCVSRRFESMGGLSTSLADSGTLRRQPGPGRSRLTSPCPGTRENAVVIARGPAVSGGIGNPRNVGDCPLYIAALDAAGEPIEERLKLEPGQSRRWYYPPQGTVEIAFACSSNCEGTATLEFDTPIA
jgi:hypothetical protein